MEMMGFAGLNPSYAYGLSRQHSPSDRLRQRDRTEECLRIEVILAGFIDNPQHIVLLGCCIAQRHVDFAFLERDRITVVFHADDQLLSLCLCHGLKAAACSRIPGDPIPAASYQSRPLRSIDLSTPASGG